MEETVEEWMPMTKKERFVLGEIRKRLGQDLDEIPDDLQLLFLRGYRHERDWIAAATEHLNSTILWRREVGAAGLLRNPPPKRKEFESQWKSGIVGVDREGRPVVLDKLGGIEPSSFLEAFPQELFVKHRVYAMEGVRRLMYYTSNKLRKRLYKLVFIVDMTGLGFSHARPSIIARIRDDMKLFEKFYPETIHRLLIINTPMVFTTAWAALTPFIHPHTIKKIMVLGGPSSYEPVFRELGITLTRSEEIGNVNKRTELSWERVVHDLQRRSFADINSVLRFKDSTPNEHEVLDIRSLFAPPGDEDMLRTREHALRTPTEEPLASSSASQGFPVPCEDGRNESEARAAPESRSAVATYGYEEDVKEAMDSKSSSMKKEESSLDTLGHATGGQSGVEGLFWKENNRGTQDNSDNSRRLGDDVPLSDLGRSYAYYDESTETDVNVLHLAD